MKSVRFFYKGFRVIITEVLTPPNISYRAFYDVHIHEGLTTGEERKYDDKFYHDRVDHKFKDFKNVTKLITTIKNGIEMICH